MKVLFLADASPIRPASGSEQVIYRQSTGLRQKGWEVYVISRRNDKSTDVQYRRIAGVREACYGADINSYFSFFKSIFQVTPRLFDELKENLPFSAFICHQPFTCLPLLIRGKLKNTPLLYVFHSPNHEEYLLSDQNRWQSFLQAKMRKRIEGYCLRRSEKIIVLSRYMKQKVVDTHGIDESRILVIPGGADPIHFQPPGDRQKLKKELRLPEGRVHLLTVRNLEPRMGLDNILEAMRVIKKNMQTVHLVVGGDGPERSNIENLISRYELTNDVCLTGFIPDKLLPKYYGAADFFILPTKHLEGFGLVTTESLACGTPVLGTPIGGTAEILGNLSKEFLFDDTSPASIAKGIQNAIRCYFYDKNKYAELRFRIRRYAKENYAWARHIDQLEFALDDVMKLNRAPNV